MGTWELFDNEAREVKDTTERLSPICVQLIKNSIGVFAESFLVLNDLEPTDAAKVKMSLLSQSFATLKCAATLAIHSYYIQSINLLRTVHENWVAFHYLTKCPDKANRWLNKSRRAPDHSAMLKALDDNFLTGKMREWYNVLCGFEHTGSIAVLSQITFTPSEISIYYGVTYNADRFIISAYAISFWAAMMLDTVTPLVPNTSKWRVVVSVVKDNILKFIDETNDRLKQNVQHADRRNDST